MSNENSDMLLIDKPKGVTSYDVIRALKKKYPKEKIGHAGTLDPLASGLMVVGVGLGTKKLKYYVDLTKTYIAEVCIGEKSATGDAEGPIVERKPVVSVHKDTLNSALQELVGVHRLPVSAYSAMKQGGEALYKKARRGETVIIPLRDMEIFEVRLVSDPVVKDACLFAEVQFTVGSGTYVRSLAEALGEKLGYPARLENLRRTKVGELRVEDATQI